MNFKDEADRFKTIVHDQSDPTNVHVSCECGEWEFRGDWDDMVSSHFKHIQHPDSHYIYYEKYDHVPQTFLSREAGEKMLEIIEQRKADG